MEIDPLPFTVLALLIVGFSAAAKRLGRWNLTAPIVFVSAGLAFSTQYASGAEELEWLRTLAELTLALVLFTDAAAVRPRQVERDGGFVARLLLIGLPLTIGIGAGTALLLFPGMPWAAALLLAAMLAPTDAALGAATVSDTRIPVRVRRILNVESGLNDGLATPVVLFAIAALAQEEGLSAGVSTVEALIEIGVGLLVGAAVGYGGGQLLRLSATHAWSTQHSRAVATLALALLAYLAALEVGGNGFIATFVAGSFFGIALRDGLSSRTLELPEGLSQPLGDATWFAFGGLLVPLLIREIGAAEIIFAVASLTALRMAPVGLSLLGSGLRPPTSLFIGWFGPRGLASVVFSLITLGSLGQDGPVSQVLATATLTILLSVVLHGMSASWGASRYAAWVQRTGPQVELGESVEPRGRGMAAMAGRGDRPPPAPPQ